MSIKPQWVSKILNGEKTIEIRKRFPKDYVGWVYVYCTKDKKYANLINRGGFLTGMVVARFWCDKVEEIAKEDYYPNDDLMSATMWFEFHTKTMDKEQILKKSCLRKSELHNYLNLKRGYAIHITKLEIFDEPRTLQPFFDLDRPPQSWCYIEI